MMHSDISAADIAWDAAQNNDRKTKDLETRVAVLEQQVAKLVAAMATLLRRSATGAQP